MAMNRTMSHWLSKQATLSPHRTAIETKNRTLTFFELQKESEAFAKKLASLGIVEQTHVAILSTNHLDMVIAIHALSYLKAVVVMLNTRLTKYELENQLKESEASVL